MVGHSRMAKGRAWRAVAAVSFLLAMLVAAPGSAHAAAVRQGVADSAAERCPDSEGIWLSSLTAMQGGAATVSFKVEEECSGVLLTLASYKAKQPHFDAKTKQPLYRHVTRRFEAGRHTVSVPVPDCYYQADFVYGEAIKVVQEGDFYGWRVIESRHGGDAPCATETVPLSMPRTGGGGASAAHQDGSSVAGAQVSLALAAILGAVVRCVRDRLAAE